MNILKHDQPCKECGKDISLYFIPEVVKTLQEYCLCHTCNFWREKEEIKNEARVVRIDGVHFSLGDEVNAPAFCKGHGGRKFVIQFNDGRVVTSTNLWCQGNIPESWRERLPNNATWVLDGAKV